MNLDRVSIIIPCYNREKYISDAIDSALNQTYSNIEIIVVDDGSTDNSVTVIKQYGKNITLIEQSNMGVNAARNTGLRNCHGDYVIFLDSDDWLSNDVVEKHIKTTKQWPSAAIYCADSMSTDKTGKESTLNRCNWPEQPSCPLSLFILTPPPFPACELYRKSVIESQGGYDETMRAFADSELRIRIILSGATVVRTEGGYGVYRPVENSITRNSLRMHRYALKLIKKLSQLYDVSNNKKLEELLAERLLRHRMRYWKNVLSYHIALKPLAIIKFIWHLARITRSDPFYIAFIIKDKPWTINENRYF